MVRIVDFFSKLLFRIFCALISFFHIKLSDSAGKALMQFIKFGIVGVSNTVISYLLYIGCLFALQGLSLPENADYLISNIVSWVISVFWSFIWNRLCVFGEEKRSEIPFFRSLLKTYCSYAFTGLLLSNVLLYLEVSVLGINKAIAPFFVLLISIPVNFLLNKFWAFKRKKDDA